ncbi:hypothetical protein NVR66_21755 [Enterobacter bugandensis]|uniref:hypothetical protein n=1 Tax=Enterobacter bugandensis TaxID=881260 RepID=UPI0023AFFD4C|nr:hypothetical protein [Enterobacter bugandensis]MDE7592239.1 hypothetical protein [Enterobacter bugandensis]
MNIDGYENRFVAFVDILGFKELIHKIESEAIEGADYQRVRSVLNFLHEESVESNGHHDLPVYEKKDGYILEKELGDPRINYISDCVIISTEGTFEGFKSLCNKLTKFSTDIACDGIFIRGGVTYGKIYHHGPMLFGSAYQRAYELESKYANNPRIVIDDVVFDFLSASKGVFPLNEHAITKDNDGLNYLANFPLNYYPMYTPSWLDFLLRIKSRILYHLNYFDPRVSGYGFELKRLDKFCCWKEVYGWDLSFDGRNEHVLKKYVWLKDEFNNTIKKYSKYLSASPRDFNYDIGVKEGMRIMPIHWNGTIWSPVKELGHYR